MFIALVGKPYVACNNKLHYITWNIYIKQYIINNIYIYHVPPYVACNLYSFITNQVFLAIRCRYKPRFQTY